MDEPRAAVPARLHVAHRAGEDPDAPTLLLVHGITDDGSCWQDVAAQLDPRWELLLPDLRGHGASPLPEGPFGLEELAADLVELIEGSPAASLDGTPAAHAGDAGGAIVVGHSLGAATAAVLAERRPELVRALVLEDPPWFDVPRSERAPMDHGAWVRELQQHDVEELVATCAASEPGWSEIEVRTWAQSKLAVDLRFFDGFDDASLDDWRATLTALDLPILLVTGDPDRNAIVTPEVAAQLAVEHEQLRVSHLAGTGHSIHRDRPEAFIDAVHGFLGEVW